MLTGVFQWAKNIHLGMKKALISILLLPFWLNGYSCLNFYGEDIHGGHHTLEHRHFETTVFDGKEIKKRLTVLNGKFAGNQYSFRDVSDYGVWMLMAGKYADGLALFREMVKKYPDEYNINQNLGTAFELNGMPDSAFYYIKKGYLLNPKSHQGSEWMHIRYLETVLSKQELDYTQFSILDTTAIGAIKNSGKGTPAHFFALDLVFEEINYQLNERIPFTLGKDEVLAKLLTETGDLYAEKFSVTRAHTCYLFAQYFTTLPEAKTQLQQRINRVLPIIEQSKKQKGRAQPPNEYYYSLRNYRLLSARKPVNTKGWDFLSVTQLVSKM